MSRALITATSFHLQPGNPKATPVVGVLDDIERLDEANTPLTEVKVGDLCDLIIIETRPSGLQIVREPAFPNRGESDSCKRVSTRLEAGPYLHDLKKFIELWTRENQHLEAHRSASEK